MRKHLVPMLAVLLIASLCHVAWAQKPTRLVVDNRSRATATVQVWRYTGYHWDWLTVATAPPARWVAVSDVKDGERFRVMGTSSTPPSHVVNLRRDPGYGGPQDVWVLQ